MTYARVVVLQRAARSPYSTKIILGAFCSSNNNNKKKKKEKEKTNVTLGAPREKKKCHSGSPKRDVGRKRKREAPIFLTNKLRKKNIIFLEFNFLKISFVMSGFTWVRRSGPRRPNKPRPESPKLRDRA